MATHRLPSDTSREIHFTVHARGLELKNSHRRAIRRILASALGRFTRRVRTIRVWLEDINGPRGGVDIRCRIEVHFRPRGNRDVGASSRRRKTGGLSVGSRGFTSPCSQAPRSTFPRKS